jgi:hypothetical protein
LALAHAVESGSLAGKAERQSDQQGDTESLDVHFRQILDET